MFAPAGRRPTYAEVDRSALAGNMAAVRRLVGDGVSIIAVVKADAYGHGAVPVSRILLENGADILSVATLDEAEELRLNGICAPVLVLGSLLPEDSRMCLELDVIPAICTIEFANALNDTAARSNKVVDYHLKIDTGMSRTGLPVADCGLLFSSLARMSHLSLSGIFSHLATADDPASDFMDEQITLFQEACAILDREKHILRHTSVMRHLANSSALMRDSRTHMDAVRPGICLYGEPAYRGIDISCFKPALSLKSSIVSIRELPPNTSVSYGRTYNTSRKELIATIPIGYADGFSRRLSNIGHVLVKGHEAPVVGRVCMDQTMINVTDIPDVGLGSEVVLIGRSGDKFITATDIADLTGTISYEVLSTIGKRIPRMYIN